MDDSVQGIGLFLDKSGGGGYRCCRQGWISENRKTKTFALSTDFRGKKRRN